MGREDGFYWVKRKDRWTVGKYWLGQWSIVGRAGTYETYEFQEVSPTRLVRPEEVK